MPGFDDPRYLQQVITDLQQRLKKLESASLPFLANQRGALPGAMRGVQIGDPGLKSAMWMNLIGQVAGQAPYSAVTDAAGTVRVEFGNLAANGISPAQFGFRASDATGAPIMDSLGLSQVMKQLGRGDVPSGPAPTFTTTTLTAISGCSVTFSLVRQARVLALFVAIGFNAAGGGVGQIDLFTDGVDQPSQTAADNADSTLWFGTNNTDTMFNTYSASLGAGSHTIDLRAKVQTTPGTLTIQGATIFVYLLGT